MIRSRHQIELKDGVKVDMLFTPSMYARGRERGIRIEIADTGDLLQVTEAYTKLMYLGAINAWEAMRFDDPGMGEFPHQYIDFVAWCGEHPREFRKIIGEIVECITGKSLSDFSKENDAQGLKKK